MSLLLRNLLFTLLHPGIIAGLIPYYIVHDNVYPSTVNVLFFYGGLLFSIAGIILTLICIGHFAVYGNGTLSPIDPTKQLVATGVYKYSRNPMYIGVMLILLGETIYFQSIYLLLYTLAIFTLFNLFIHFFEEPRLKKEFGQAYIHYCHKVRRWI